MNEFRDARRRGGSNESETGELPRTPEPQLTPALIDVWNHLVEKSGTAFAWTFFESHVIDGKRLLSAMRSLLQGALPEPESSGRRLGEERPKTEVDLARHREILERKWLVTGHVLMVRQEDADVRRIPLNYRHVSIGSASSAQDIVLDLGPDVEYHARLQLQDERFVVIHRDGTVPTLVNGERVDSALLQDGDVISVGPYDLRIFKLLEPPAELQIVNGPGAGERFVIDISEVWLGRPGKRVNDIDLPSTTVSREHASIEFRNRRFWLVPQTATSPTAINGVPVEGSCGLADNDQIVLGELTLMFRLRGPGARAGMLETRIATVLFFDLRGWTSLAESTPLEHLVAQVNEYYSAMGEIIHRYGGTLMSYQGDGIMAVFGAPSAHADDPLRAVAAALRMLRQMEVLSAKWVREGKRELRGGIGIHTGQVIVGELGHSSRLEYAAVGDATNLAARLEQLTKEKNCSTIISESTFREVEPYVNAQPLGTVTVKGRSVPTEIYEVRSLKDTSAYEEEEETARSGKRED